MNSPLKVFISYSHKDEELKNDLENHLSHLIDSEKIEIWSDRKLIAGDDWEDKIDQKLFDCNVILFLVSADFLASVACKKEVDMSKKRIDAKESVLLVPVVLRDCQWKKTSLGKIQGLPDRGKAVTSSKHWDSLDAAFSNVAEGLENLLDNKIKEKSTSTKSGETDIHRYLPDPDNLKREVVETDKYNCDRNVPHGKFEEHLFGAKTPSKFYFVFGDPQEQPDSFFRRVYHETMHHYAQEKIKKVEMVNPNSTPYTIGDKLPASINRFKKILEREIRMEDDESLEESYTAENLAHLNAIRSYNVLVLYFKFYTKDWWNNDTCYEFVQWLANNFLSVARAKQNDAEIIVFFNMVMSEDRSLLGRFKSRNKRVMDQINVSINSLDQHDFSSESLIEETFCDLGELRPVDHTELEKWFQRFYGNAARVQEIVGKLFGSKSKPRNMAEVELVLEKVVDCFLNRLNNISK